MSVPKPIHEAIGLWRGKYQLNLPWLAPDKRVTESESQLHVSIDERGTIATITYDWHYEGKRQEGTIIVAEGGKSKAVQFGWVDSWHQNTGVLHSTGVDTGTGPIKVKGSYGAGKEVWGWTSSLELKDDRFEMVMENVTPAGEATWAVKATYTRD